MPKRKQLTLSQMRDLYKSILKKDIPNAYKNNFQWLSKQVSAVNTNMEYSQVNITINNNYIREDNNNNYDLPIFHDNKDGDAEPAKKQQKKTDLVFDELLSRKATYEDFIKFNKLRDHASDEMKDTFVKKATNRYGGGEATNSISKLSSRKKANYDESLKARKNVNSLFFDADKRQRIKLILTSLDNLIKNGSSSSSNGASTSSTTTDASSSRTNDNAIIEKEFVPIVYDKLCLWLQKQSAYLKTAIIEEKITTFVDNYERLLSNSSTQELKTKISDLKQQLANCPETTYFTDVRDKLKNDLKKYQKELLALETGSENTSALDLSDGASQMY